MSPSPIFLLHQGSTFPKNEERITKNDDRIGRKSIFPINITKKYIFISCRNSFFAIKYNNKVLYPKIMCTYIRTISVYIWDFL